MAPLKVKFVTRHATDAAEFSMPLKHGPIEGAALIISTDDVTNVFHAPKAWPH